MKEKIDFSGLTTPILTPFKNDGSIDERSFLQHIDFLAENGIKRILVNGTTGEFFSLTPAEQKRLFTLTRKHFSGLVLMHTGAGSLAQTSEIAAWAVDNGANAILALPPYYMANVPPQGLIEYFNAIAQTLTVPLILYNFPKHTQNPLTPEILAAVDHFGIKDSSADLSLIPATDHYYVGGDDMILEAHQQGAYGFVSARSNAFPAIFAKMESALATNDMTTATKLQADISKIKQNMTGPNGIAIIKYALAKSIPTYPQKTRPPLITLPNEQRQKLDEFIDQQHHI